MGERYAGRFATLLSTDWIGVRCLPREPVAGLLGDFQCRSTYAASLNPLPAFMRASKALADGIGMLLVDGFHHLALFAIGATTVWSALEAFWQWSCAGMPPSSDILFFHLSRNRGDGRIYFKTTRCPSAI